MRDADIEQLCQWLTGAGLEGMAEAALLQQLCERCAAHGLRLAGVLVIIDTLHPIHEGRAFVWRRDRAESVEVVEYGRTDRGDDATERWQRSASFRMVADDATEIRSRLLAGEGLNFTEVEALAEYALTDFLALRHCFAADAVIGEMDSVYVNWLTDAPGGFDDADLAALRRLTLPLALAIKSAALARIVATLAEVYLGTDAAQLVLQGRIRRGVAERIHAVLWFSDLRGYTTITDTAPPDEIIPLLNDYADQVISAICEAGGDVLKLIGDGTLAVFKAADPAEACRAALQAERTLRSRLRALDAERGAAGRPVTSVYLGLHVGEVFFGNIGSESRLDFTVVGPAVNEVARIASMCRSVDRHMLLSSEFVAATPAEERADLVSLGRFALRGVGRPRELFTLDPELVAAGAATEG